MHQKKCRPPWLAERMIEWISWNDDRAFILDDLRDELEEIFFFRGRAAARRWYWFHTVRSVLPCMGREFIWRGVMLKNYLKVALRNMNRKKIYAGINISGLAIGMACAMFILMWIRDERGYDRFHANAGRIYRLYQVFHYDDYHLEQANTPAILASTLQDQCPEVQMVTRVRGYREENLVTVEGKKFNESGIGIADENFFKLFSFPLIMGDPESVLSEAQAVVISERAAEKYFGVSDPVGRTLNIFNEDFQVSGVFHDMPDNSHFHFDALCSYASFQRYHQPQWGMNVFKTYVLLRENGSVEALQSKLIEIVKNYMFDSEERYAETLAKGNSTTFPLQSLKDIHLTSNLLWEFESNGNRTYVRFFSIIAAFILLIAAINYMNLSTARSAGRAREVGIRKTVGSTRPSLIRQFLFESVFTSVFAMILCAAVIQILMPAFRLLVGKPWLEIPYIEQPLLIPPLAALAVLIGIIAGIYPSFYLSSFQPLGALKGMFQRGLKRSSLRTALVIFQFSLSILLLSATLVVRKQMAFIQDRSLGFNQEQVVVVKTYGELGQKISVLKEAFLNDPAVVSVSASSSIPGKAYSNVGMGLEGTGSNHGTNLFITDVDFLETMKMEMEEGHFFSQEIPTDRQAVVINESEARSLGVDDLLSKRMRIWVGGEDMTLFHIIGIVKDFHYESFHEPVKPMVMVMLDGACPWPESFVSIRLRSRDARRTLAVICDAWEEVLPGLPFAPSFLDAIFNDQYHNEARTGRIFTIFTLFAIFVACLGLFGLASFASEQRTKEIGIRKILGAPVLRIVVMLSGEFARWVAAANLIAWPAAYLLMNHWLGNFAYRTGIGLEPFVTAALIMLTVIGLTVGYHALKSATARPVDALRYE